MDNGQAMGERYQHATRETHGAEYDEGIEHDRMKHSPPVYADDWRHDTSGVAGQHCENNDTGQIGGGRRIKVY